VPDFFLRLQERKIQVSIYSSGSVEAQKYIFKHSNFGDISKYISNYFDINVGSKKEPESYIEIARQLGSNPNRVLFFTDIKEEADACSRAGLSVFIMNRPGNHSQPIHNYPILTDFTTLL
jgi:enolase-phosphatase E1